MNIVAVSGTGTRRTRNGSARLAMSSERPTRVELAFSQFDPAAWGRFPAGSIKARSRPTARWAPLRGERAVRHREIRAWLGRPARRAVARSTSLGTPAPRRLDLTIGANRLPRRAPLAGPSAARRPDAVPLRGKVRGNQGRKRWHSSSMRQGSARSTSAARRLARHCAVKRRLARAQRALPCHRHGVRPHQHMDARKRLEARGVLGMDAAAPLEIEASVARAVRARLATAQREPAHRRQPQCSRRPNRSPGRAHRPDRARAGSLRPEGLGRHDRRTRQRRRSRRAPRAAVAVEVSAQRVLRPFELRLVGGRLDVSRLSYERGRLSRRRAAWPNLRCGAAVRGLPPRLPLPRRNVRINGHWDLASAPQLTGQHHARARIG